MYKPMQLIINFESSDEIEQYMHDLNNVEEIRSRMDEISRKLRAVIKHCDMPDEIERELSDIRGMCYNDIEGA